MRIGLIHYLYSQCAGGACLVVSIRSDPRQAGVGDLDQAFEAVIFVGLSDDAGAPRIHPLSREVTPVHSRRGAKVEVHPPWLHFGRFS